MKKVTKYILNNIIIKYSLCYLLSAILIFFLNYMDNNSHWYSIICSIIATLISLPLIFIIYDLYNEVLSLKTRQQIDNWINKDLCKIFISFIYFTKGFYTEISKDTIIDPNEIDTTLNLSQDEIFDKVSSVHIPGFFLFAEFESFDQEIIDILDSPLISKFIGKTKLATLLDFCNKYKEFKEKFSFVSKENIIVFGKYENYVLEKSALFDTNRSDTYDVKYKIDDQSFIPFYVARYNCFDENAFLHSYKLSGNFAKEISTSIYSLYKLINEWLDISNITTLEAENAIVVQGRLFLESNFAVNEHMTSGMNLVLK